MLNLPYSVLLEIEAGWGEGVGEGEGVLLAKEVKLIFVGLMLPNSFLASTVIKLDVKRQSSDHRLN